MLRILLIMIFATGFLQAQNTGVNFYLDSYVRKNMDEKDSDSCSYTDVFITVPNSELYFKYVDDSYLSKIEFIIEVVNLDDNESDVRTIKENHIVNDFLKTQSANGEMLLHHETYKLKPGEYEIVVMTKVDRPLRTSSLSKKITIPDYNANDLGISSILLLSSLEEGDDGYKITPFLKDNIGEIKDRFFLFQEVFSNKELAMNVNYEVIQDEKLIFESDDRLNKINEKNTGIYIPAKISEDVFGKVDIKVNFKDPSSNELLISTIRTVNVEQSYISNLVNDIDEAIRQLRYVATFEQISTMRDEESIGKRTKLFNEFWKELDPSPNTKKNEAIEEYYTRILYANENFKSMSQGWLTDRGMIYVVMGQPLSINRSTPNQGNRNYERWIYNNNMQFLFEDRTGFGDFRLVQPMSFNQKYKYSR